MKLLYLFLVPADGEGREVFGLSDGHDVDVGPGAPGDEREVAVQNLLLFRLESTFWSFFFWEC